MAKQGSDKKLVVKQVRSAIGRDVYLLAVLRSLGLGRIGSERILPANSAVLGALRKIDSIVTVKEQ